MAQARDPSASPGELDRATIEAAAVGEAWATRRLVECTERSVHRYAWRMLGPRATQATTADLVQDIYARVFRSLPRYRVDGAARFTTWMLTIAHHTAVDELRRKRPSVGPLHERHPGRAGDRPDHLRERAELGERIAAEVQKLTPALRSAFILRAYHDRSLAEIATALDIDEGTVKSRLHRARRSLQAALEEVRHET